MRTRWRETRRGKREGIGKRLVKGEGRVKSLGVGVGPGTSNLITGFPAVLFRRWTESTRSEEPPVPYPSPHSSPTPDDDPSAPSLSIGWTVSLGTYGFVTIPFVVLTLEYQLYPLYHWGVRMRFDPSGSGPPEGSRESGCPSGQAVGFPRNGCFLVDLTRFPRGAPEYLLYVPTKEGSRCVPGRSCALESVYTCV